MSYGDNTVRARMPFVDVARPQAQTGGRRHPGTMVPLGQLGHEAKAANSCRTQARRHSRG
jgi:hypothetical protein